MITKGKYLTIRISEDDMQRIKADAKQAELSLTGYVLSKLINVPTNVITEPSQVAKKIKAVITNTRTGKNSDYVMAKNISVIPTKPQAVPPEQLVVAKPAKLCHNCKATIKSGFLCEKCKN